MSWHCADPIMIKVLRNERVEMEIRDPSPSKALVLFVKAYNEKYCTSFVLIKDDSKHDDDWVR